MKLLRLATICARGGSKGLKDKNIKPFFGKSLIAHTIEIVRLSQLFDVLAVSSDSQTILQIADDCKVDYVIERPVEMALDTAAKLPAIQHCAKAVENLSGINFDTFVDISVTSPLIIPEDIQNAVKLLENSDAMNLITGTRAAHSPYFSMVESQSNNFVKLAKQPITPFERRQDCPICYSMNGAIYVWPRKWFHHLTEIITEKTLLLEMPPERSQDIDSSLDFEIACFLYARKLSKNKMKELV